MPTGQPDFWASNAINILEQSLANLVIRPTQGSYKYLTASGTVNPGDAVILIELTGKGQCVFWDIGWYSSGDSSDCEAGIWVDDSGFLYTKPGQLYESGELYPGNGFFLLRRYEPTNYQYGICSGGPIVFEKNFSLRFRNTSSVAVNISAVSIYAWFAF